MGLFCFQGFPNALFVVFGFFGFFGIVFESFWCCFLFGMFWFVGVVFLALILVCCIGFA